MHINASRVKKVQTTKGICARMILVVIFVAGAIVIFLIFNNKLEIETMAQMTSVAPDAQGKFQWRFYINNVGPW